MRYGTIVCGEFIARPNRFTAHVLIGGRRETVHVKNTGRCRELLVPGCKVWLEKAENPLRKTGYDLIAVEKIRHGKLPLLINMDSQIPNKAAEEYFRNSDIFSPGAVIKREVKYHNSRFDLYITDAGRRIFCEVKGVTLEENGRALFPDAPTLRGVKHLKELAGAVAEGYEAWVFFVIQMNEINSFAPNDATHPLFGETLRSVAAAGVKIIAKCCNVTPGTVTVIPESDVPIAIGTK